MSVLFYNNILTFTIEIYFHADNLKLAPAFCLRVHSDLDTWAWVTSHEDIKNVALLCFCMVEQSDGASFFGFFIFQTYWTELCCSNSSRLETSECCYNIFAF